MKNTGYFKKDRENPHQIRRGREAPEDSVHLGYIQTPDVSVEDVVNMTDESTVSENIIPEDDRESVLISNEDGQLEYINYFGSNQFRRRDPGYNIPSKDIALTKRFYRKDLKYRNALFYKVYLDYHYDSQASTDEETREYLGNQIVLLNEAGEKIQNEEELVYQIFVTPQKNNPHIYRVMIYLSKNTDNFKTFRVRYNHTEKDIEDDKLISVRSEISFYTGDSNTVQVTDDKGNNITKHMLESGKIRILNGTPMYEEKSLKEVIDERMNNSSVKEEIYSIQENENGGYTIIVPERTVEDTRDFKNFAYRIMAIYEDFETGEKHEYSSGWIYDIVMDQNSILPFEETEYMGEYKRLGIPKDEGFVNSVKEMLDVSLPFGIDGIPDKSKIWIEDTNGDVLYHIKKAVDDETTDSIIDVEYAYAKNSEVKETRWVKSGNTEYIYESEPISSKYSIIPEKQEKKWDFSFEVDGEGYVEEEVKIEGTWRVGARFTEKISYETEKLDVNDRSYWFSIGAIGEKKESPLKYWMIDRDRRTGRTGLTFTENNEDIIGYYRSHRNDENGNRVSTDGDSDYEFSVRVRMNDLIDDDVVGLIFRLRNVKSYYFFAWEKDETQVSPKKYIDYHAADIQEWTNPQVYQGTGRPNFSEHGYQAVKYSAGYKPEQLNELTERDKDAFLTERGMGLNHKRIYKVTPSVFDKNAKNEEDFMENPNQRYPLDETESSFYDITELDSPSYSPKGWKPTTDYKITVVAEGGHFQIYINEVANSKERGTLVCEAYDESYESGSYGIAVVSQRWTFWDQFQKEEVDDIIIWSDEIPHTFESKKLELMSETKISKLMKPIIDEFLENDAKEGAKYKFAGYVAGETDTTVSFLNEDYVVARPKDHLIEEIKHIPWKASENRLSVRGKGTVNYHEDGYLDIEYEPKRIPKNTIPKEVLNFRWNDPHLTSGHSVHMVTHEQKYIGVSADVPPVTQIGDIYHSREHELSKDKGIEEIDVLFKNAQQLKRVFNIPTDINMRDILLRIEKGHVSKANPDGTVETEGANEFANYRFRVERDRQFKYPVDQHRHEVGMNRLRVSQLLDVAEEEVSGFKTSVVGWTHLPNLRAYPLFGLKVHESQRIYSEMPRVEYPYQKERGWYPRVKAGRLTRKIELPKDTKNKLYKRVKKLSDYAGKEVYVHYEIPEYKRVEFLKEPHVLMQSEEPQILSRREIKVKHRNLILKDHKSFSIRVECNRDGNVFDLKISDVDSKKGIIYLHEDVAASDILKVDYMYKEEFFTYSGFYYNEKELELELDINPSATHTYSVEEQAIFNGGAPYPEEERDKKIIKKESKELIGGTVYLYLIPIAYETEEGELIKENAKEAIHHTFVGDRFSPQTEGFDPTLFLLSRINLSFAHKADMDTLHLDTRQRGGGLKERVTRRDIERISRDALSNWDIGHWDGFAYQENGVVIIRINDKVFEENSKEVVDKRAHEVVQKYKAYGIYPIIEYYSEDGYGRVINQNGNFLNGEHTDYYYPEKTWGDVSIDLGEHGGYDDYHLNLSGNSQYAIRVPGYRLSIGEAYRFSIKATKKEGSSNRKAFSLYIEYRDDPKPVVVESNMITVVNHWREVFLDIEIDKEIKYIDMIIGDEKTSERDFYRFDNVYITPIGKRKEE